MIARLSYVHLVNMVPSEYAYQVRTFIMDEVYILINSVRGALVPILTDAHLGGYKVDRMTYGWGEVPCPRDVRIQRFGFVLREDLDLVEARVYEIAQNEVYDPVPASEGNSRFCPVLRKRVQSFTFTAGKDHDKNSFADHSNNLSFIL